MSSGVNSCFTGPVYSGFAFFAGYGLPTGPWGASEFPVGACCHNGPIDTAAMPPVQCITPAVSTAETIPPFSLPPVTE